MKSHMINLTGLQGIIHTGVAVGPHDICRDVVEINGLSMVCCVLQHSVELTRGVPALKRLVRKRVCVG